VTTFHERLTQRMKRRIGGIGVTADTDLAAALGVHYRRVARLRRGDQPPTLDDVITLARVLGCSRAWLAFGDGAQ